MNETTAPTPLDTALKHNPQLNDPYTVAGIEALIAKLAPLVQGQRLHNLVDLASAASDVVDMADAAMVQKLANDYENMAMVVFNLNNALRYATAQAALASEPPTIWQMVRHLKGDADVRRGISVMLALLSVLGRDARLSQATCNMAD